MADSNRNKSAILNTLLSIFSTILAFSMLEFSLRLFVVPSDHAFGELLGRPLPPLAVVPTSSVLISPDAGWPNSDLTIGDLLGFFRLDPVIGYVTDSNRLSKNGW